MIEETIDLGLRRWAVTKMREAGLNPQRLETVEEYQIIYKRIIDEIIVYFLSTNHTEERDWTYPSTWFQHLRKRLGLKYRTKTIVIQTIHTYVCPHLSQKVSERPHVEWMISKKS